MYCFTVALRLPRCRGSLYSEQGLFFTAEAGLLVKAASLVAEPALSSCPTAACGTLPDGIRPLSPALAGGWILTRCTTRDIRLFSDFKTHLGRFAHSPVTKKLTHGSWHLLHFSHLLLDPRVTCLVWCVAWVWSGLLPGADCSSHRLLTTWSPPPHRGLGAPGSRVCLCRPRVPVLACLHVPGASGSRGRPRGREAQTFLLSLLGKVSSAVFVLPLLM